MRRLVQEVGRNERLDFLLQKGGEILIGIHPLFYIPLDRDGKEFFFYCRGVFLPHTCIRLWVIKRSYVAKMNTLADTFLLYCKVHFANNGEVC